MTGKNTNASDIADFESMLDLSTQFTSSVVPRWQRKAAAAAAANGDRFIPNRAALDQQSSLDQVSLLLLFLLSFHCILFLTLKILFVVHINSSTSHHSLSSFIHSSPPFFSSPPWLLMVILSQTIQNFFNRN